MKPEDIKEEIKSKDVKELLAQAVSDVGFWQWWDEVEGDYMVEFGGVLLYDETKKDKESRTSSVAICFYDNAFLVFLDNANTDLDWYVKLHDDEMDPQTLDPDGFVFDDVDYAIELLDTFKKRHGNFSSKEEAVNTIKNAKNLLAGTCGDYGFIIGGDYLKVNGRNGYYSEDDIKKCSTLWWDYWREYWKLKGTDEAYEDDYACEVTIPLNEGKGIIACDDEMIKKIVRFEVDPGLFHPDNEDLANYLITGSYIPTYEDLVAACINMIQKEVDQETFENWHYYVSEELNEACEYVWIESIGDTRNLWPNTDETLFRTLDSALDYIGTFTDYSSQQEFAEKLEEVIQIAEDYKENKGKDVKDWKIGKLLRKMILLCYYERTELVSKSKKEVFKRIVDEECENEDVSAMHIKGYGCYGGDNIYECDWEESKKLITKLFEKTENPTYANTLGYIYYYGRCNNGVPEYEKAFQYFSIGAAHGVMESMYKQADMYLSGKGCIKSPDTADHIYGKLYEDAFPRFLDGEDAKFADIALRMATGAMRKELFELALRHVLEAEAAIKWRLKKSDFFGDKKVAENIEKTHNEIKEKLPKEFIKEEYETEVPEWMEDMLWDGCKSKLSIERIKENQYRIKLERIKKDNQAKALIADPELDAVTVTRKFDSLMFPSEPVEYIDCKDKDKLFVDHVEFYENEIVFFYGKKKKVIIRNAKFLIRKIDFN